MSLDSLIFSFFREKFDCAMFDLNAGLAKLDFCTELSTSPPFGAIGFCGFGSNAGASDAAAAVAAVFSSAPARRRSVPSGGAALAPRATLESARGDLMLLLPESRATATASSLSSVSSLALPASRLAATAPAAGA